MRLYYGARCKVQGATFNTHTSVILPIIVIPTVP